MTKEVRVKEIPEYKKKLVEALAEKMKSSKTVLIASTKGLPSSQFHEIKKKLRGKTDIKVAKKSAVLRALKKTEKGALQSLKEQIGADIALFFSDIDAFELSGLLSDNKSPSKAKVGDTSPEDIEIEPGPTELLPGPAISELSSVGLKVAVENGKLSIKKGAVVVKAGEAINENVASVLGKLGITPMKVGFEPIAAYDANSDKVYVGIKIDKEATLEELRQLIGKALSLAVSRGYTTKETISYLIAKAGAEERALEKKVGEAKPEEKREEVVVEEKKEEVVNVKSESNEDNEIVDKPEAQENVRGVNKGSKDEAKEEKVDFQNKTKEESK